MRAAFSLVELSIVLVILGLLTGGILTGQSLIRAAELRSVATEFQAYQTAVMTFRDKYFALPGDMPNATDFWGAMTNCGAASPSGTGTQTCNGDGDGIADEAGAASQTGELYNFWQQLANAGLVEGAYTGIAGSNSGRDIDLGINSPKSKLSAAGWGLRHMDLATATLLNSFMFTLDYGNALFFGGEHTAAPEVSVLTPEELWNIDTKIDDGLPAQGKLIARPSGLFSGTINCVNAANAADYAATYKLDDSAIGCAIIFKKAF